ncbi:hypothetical protein [Paenisporosarcina antarctica]|uniref:Uncharacterized protein n=1 Tax=Paenisporosarcina antarctica TaxID=417367 RepID=A0A4V1ANH1_9BACL|nr:hypothetical protein [Paenisporosarcina antarctica]QBP42755.1 hypothetical protein E2636_17135 [Paenisporosarcina antarctica]
MKKKVFTEEDRQLAPGPFGDNPDNVKTDKISLFDMHEDMMFTDVLLVEELNKQVINDPARKVTKDPSANEEIHPN